MRDYRTPAREELCGDISKHECVEDHQVFCKRKGQLRGRGHSKVTTKWRFALTSQSHERKLWLQNLQISLNFGSDSNQFTTLELMHFHQRKKLAGSLTGFGCYASSKTKPFLSAAYFGSGRQSFIRLIKFFVVLSNILTPSLRFRLHGASLRFASLSAGQFVP